MLGNRSKKVKNRWTRRNLINRLKEHFNLNKSEVCLHLTDNSDHKVDFANRTFLAALAILHAYYFLNHFLCKSMSHCLTLTPNPLLFTYLIINLTTSVVFSLLVYDVIITLFFKLTSCLGYAITSS